VLLYVADDVMEVCRSAGLELGQVDPPLPYWAFPWAGGSALARYLFEHPDEVAGRRVIDLAAGSGLCGIVAARLGAASVLAIDVDPLAQAAVAVNARANKVRIAFGRRWPEPRRPSCDVILAGDVCYDEAMTDRVMAWLRPSAEAGVRVLIGDPGRRYLPADLVRLAAYEIRTTRELEDAEVKESGVFTLPTGA
jgi:predicted nicotinamide N-methyase